jgi:membrane protein YqaA with SNARE-associated domain
MIYLTLLLECAGHASIIPFISDTTYYAMASFGGYNMALAFALAVAGGTAGQALNLLLGRGLHVLKTRGYFLISDRWYARYQPLFSRFGIWLLLLSFLPLFNFFSLLAGFFRTRLPLALTLIAIGQAFNYGRVLF